VPPGTYLQSCYGCNIIEEDGKSILSCECSKFCGTLKPTRHIIDGSCRAFGNKDGELFCDKEMENEEGVPKGPYEKECGGCSYDKENRMLACKKCPGKQPGSFVESSLKVPEEGCEIINSMGELKCKEPVDDPMADEKAVKNPTANKEEL